MDAPVQSTSQKLLSQVCGYGLVSAVALAVDMSVLQGLVKVAGWHYLLASGCAFCAGACVAYLLSVRFVFESHKIRNRPLEFGYFVALGLAGLLVNAGALFVAVSAAGLSLITAKLFAAVCTFATNFTLRRQLLFAPSRSS
jgi:putative flippase GtrA